MAEVATETAHTNGVSNHDNDSSITATTPNSDPSSTDSTSVTGLHNITVAISAYTFYLNLVVIDQMPGATPEKAGKEEETPAKPEKEEEEEVATPDPKKKDLFNIGKFSKVNFDNISRAMNNIDAGKGIHNLSKAVMNLEKGKENFKKSLRETSIRVIETSKEMSQKAENFGQKTAAYVASKTMVTRANMALSKALEQVSSQYCNMSIGKRFQQGPVIVIQVNMKSGNLAGYISQVRGDEAAEQYVSAVNSLKALGATETIGTLEREMLPKMKQGLMDKMSDNLIQAMKDKDKALALECIPLDEREEAHWLFTYIEFQNQMMKKATSQKE